MIDTLVLWDLDGTILTTGRSGLAAWVDAVDEVLGRNVDLSTFPTAGLTDRMIARDLVECFGPGPGPAGAGVRLLHAYLRRLPQRLDPARGRVLPNVVAVTDALASTSRVHQLLLTGNARSGAMAKLTTYGVADRFGVGAFCDDGFDRVEIGRACLRLAESAVGRVLPSRTYVIGDTPLDIACAHGLGVRSIAVATGEYGEDELAPHDPWLILPELPDAAEMLRLLDL